MITNPKTFFEQFQNFIEESGLQLKKFKSNLSNYFTKSEAIDTFLSKTDQAESAKKADEAIKATQDSEGNVISSAYLKTNTASTTYLTQANASSTYLTKTGKAASASKADTAGSATKATQDASGNVITSTYATKDELSTKLDASDAFTKAQADTLYLGKTAKAASAATADTATSATSAVNATKATQDASGNVITTTYATKSEVNTGLADKANTSHTHTKSQITDFPAIPDTSTLIPKSGNRGAIAGYEQWTNVGATTTLSVSSGDTLRMDPEGKAATITVERCSVGQVATKLVWVFNSNGSITINGSVDWFGGDIPTLNKATAALLFVFHDGYTDCRLIGQWG